MDEEDILDDLGWREKFEEKQQKTSASSSVDYQKPSTSKATPSVVPIDTQERTTHSQSVKITESSEPPTPLDPVVVVKNLPRKRGRQPKVCKKRTKRVRESDYEDKTGVGPTPLQQEIESSSSKTNIGTRSSPIAVSPEKSGCKTIEPLRESIRLKKATQILEYTPANTRRRCLWTEADKKLLLKALEEHGPSNVKLIKEYFPDKLVYDVSNQIKHWRDLAQLEVQRKLVSDKKQLDCAIVNTVTKLDEWIEHFAAVDVQPSPDQFALANIFSFIAEFAEFPEPDDCDRVDFRAMYRYLHSLLNGEPFYGLNPETARVLNENISHLFAMIREMNRVNNLQPYLYMPELRPVTAVKTYGRSSKSTYVTSNPEAFLTQPGINPLNLPPHALMKPAIEINMDFDFKEENSSPEAFEKERED